MMKHNNRNLTQPDPGRLMIVKLFPAVTRSSGPPDIKINFAKFCCEEIAFCKALVAKISSDWLYFFTGINDLFSEIFILFLE